MVIFHISYLFQLLADMHYKLAVINHLVTCEIVQDSTCKIVQVLSLRLLVLRH